MNLDSAVLYTHDLDKTISFYRDVVGLTLEYQQENKYVSFIFTNGTRLGIKSATEKREVPGAQTVFISVDNIEEKYEVMKAKGTAVLKGLTEKTYGIEFSILDPDNNKVMFIKRL